MSTKTKQKKKTTDPLQSTGSTDEYETDDFSPSEESDTDNVAAASYNNRRDDYNGTPAATMRGGARSSQRGKNSSGKKKKNSFTNGSANTKGGKKSRSIDEVELLSSEKEEEEEEDDSYEGDTETYDKKKSSKKGRAKRNNNSEDDNDTEEESTNNNKRGRRALGHLNDNKSNTSKSPVNGGDSSEGDGAGDNNENNDDDSDDDSDPFANLGKRSNKRQKLQQKKNKGSDEDDSDSDSDDSDSDDSSMGMGLGRNRSAQLAKRRQKMMATHTYSSSDDEDDSSDSDDSLSDKKKKKKPAAKKKSNALDDSDSSISFLGTQSRKNPSRKTTKSPQKKPAAASNKQPAGNKGKRKSSILDTSCEILSSDDDFDLPKTITTTTSARSSPRKQPVAASASKKPMSQDTERDPSVRKASTKALDEARKAREALKAAQQYKAKEAVLPPIDVDLPSSSTTSRSRTGGGGGMEVVDVDMISSFPSQPSVPVTAPVSYKGPRITLTLRYQNPTTKKESKANIKIKTDQPLQHLVDEFNTQQPSLEITIVKFDGQNLSLKNTPSFYEMEDEDLVDVVVVVKQQNAASAPSFFGGLASRAAQALGVSSPSAAQAVTLATVHVQTRGNQSQKHTFQIKNDAPLSKVVTAYCEKYDLISMRLEHNGRMLDTNKSLSAEGLPNEVHLDAVDLVQGGPSIKLKFRVYGKVNDITTLSIPMKGRFESIMGRFAQKKNLSVSQCKFIFDGETLNPNSTPEGLDLEGDEIIDVRLPESNSSSSSASATGASLAPGRQISIQTNRNRNTSSRQKSWKVHNTNSISKLQTDYIKYYKSKGCQTVKFYFRNAAINNMTQSFRDLGVHEGAMLFAMENGKPYS